MNIMKQAVVLDKSFLQAASPSAIQELASSHRLVISWALFYELLTCDTRGRRCFHKLPKTENPVDLVENIGKLMKLEINTHQPAGKPSSHKENIRFIFNPKLLTDDYQMPSDSQEAINEQTDMLQFDIEKFITIAKLTPEIFPNLLSGTDKERIDARCSAEKMITDKVSLLSFYAQLQSPDHPNSPFPPHNLLDESWAIYRWLQVQMLFSIDLFVRYAGNIPAQLTLNIHTKLEHDVLDAQVLMLGCLEGAFATREKKLISWWHLLCPNGELFQ